MTNRSQKVLTEQGLSSALATSVGTPQGCVISPLLFSIYAQHMPKPSSGNFHLIKYADDTVLIELLSRSDVSCMGNAAQDLAGWCHDNDLFLNVSKTKELVLCNLRDNPVHDSLVINGNNVEQVDSFKYLGTIIDKKLKFQEYSIEVIKKARKRLYIMKKLYSMHIAVPLRMQCYTTFIECIFLYHLSTLYGHLSSSSRKSLNRVISLAGYLGSCKFDTIEAIYERVMRTRCLRLVATDHADPVFTFDKLPSGRYRAIKTRVNIRTDCFRSLCVRKLNSILF